MKNEVIKLLKTLIDEIEKENWTVVDYYFDIKNINKKKSKDYDIYIKVRDDD